MTNPVPLVLRNPNDPDEILDPMPHQLAFERSGARNTFLAGGWGSAKTTAGLRWIARSMVANPGLPGIICQPTYSILKEFVETDFIPAFFPYISSVTNGGRLIKMIDGTRIIGLSYDRLDLFEKHTAAWLYGDEAAVAKGLFFTKATARVRHPKAKHLRIGLTGTPHFGWMKDAFEGRDDSERRIIHANTNDNIHLPKDFISNLYNNCPARMRKAYIEGHFVAPGGSVYPEWDPDQHVRAWPFDHTAVIIPAFDWSPRTPHVLFAQMVPDGHPIPWPDLAQLHGPRFKKLDQRHQFAAMVIVDELIPDGSMQPVGTDRLCSDVRKRGHRFTHFVCDPAGTAAQSTSGRDDVRMASEMLGAKPVMPRTSSERLIANGVDMVRRLLAPLDGMPRIFVAQEVADRAASLPQHLKARSIVNAVPGYSYAEIQDGKAVNSDPIKDGVTDHACDCLRYTAVKLFPASRLMVRAHKDG